MARIFLAFCLLVSLVLLSSVVRADDASLERRLSLAEQMQDIRPARDQVNGAIEAYVLALPEEVRSSYRAELQDVLNYKALEKISIDAYADVFTEAELRAMVEYYSKPESRSAADKLGQYANIVYPEIVRMLDQAKMRIRAGSE